MNSLISPAELKRLLDGGVSLTVLDVRLIEDRSPVDHPIPGAVWRNPDEVESWRKEIGAEDTVVVYCVHGLRVSQGVCAALRAQGTRVSYLEGGIEEWGEFIRSGINEAGA
ncbi:MAG: rhodanese-like domain-containing protein [Gammaproteobacteria bacterium]|nr:rhodanese-like domain-containing protein [Gammaproteobacteria bacterium]MDH3412918.1 rhodanese-like domain-containing protein [Gammaproteobacteria bacterium]